MLNLAEFVGLCPGLVKQLPAVAYFHENQLTYPNRFESERDYQFVMTNLTTALTAKSVWFNSAFHRDSFLDALRAFLKKMPDFQPTEAIEHIRDKSIISPPGVKKISAPKGPRKPGPMRIIWAARWEHDKNPDEFFDALEILKVKGIDFRLSVVGESFRDCPEVFSRARNYFKDNINLWGYQQRRGQYLDALKKADIFVSTANHEFFGISAVEATLAGAYPVLPRRLAYPDIMKLETFPENKEFFYNGAAEGLAKKLTKLAEKIQNNCLWTKNQKRLSEIMSEFIWGNAIKLCDLKLAKIADNNT